MNPTFDPIQSGDYTTNLRESLQQQNEGNARIDAANRVNQEFDIRMSGQNLKDLAHLTKSGGEIFKNIWQQRETAKKAQLHMWYEMNNGEGLEQQVQDYRDFKNKARPDHKQISTIVENDEDMPWYTKMQYKDMSKWERSYINELQVKKLASMYDPLSIPEIKNALSRDEYEGALQAYTQNFYTQFGDLKEGYVYDTVTKGFVIPAKQEALKKWNTARAKDVDEGTISTATEGVMTAFGSTKLLAEQPPDQQERGSSFEDFSTTVYGIYNQNEFKIREEFEKIIENEIDGNEGSLNSIRAIGEELYEGKPINQYSWGKPMIERLLQKQVIHEINRENRLGQQQEIKGKAYVRTEIDSYLNGDKELTEDNVKESLKQARALNANTTELERMLQHSTHEAKTKQKWTDIADQMVEDGTLTQHALDEMPWYIKSQSKYRQVAKLQTTVSADELGYGKAIEADAKSAVNTNLMVRNPGSADHAAMLFKNMYNTRALKYARAGIEDPYKLAYEEVKGYIEDLKTQTYKLPGQKERSVISHHGVYIPLVNKNGPPIPEDRDAFIQQLDNTVQFLKGPDNDGSKVLDHKTYNDDGTVSESTHFFDNAKILKDELKLIGTKGWVENPVIRYLANETGFTYQQVIQKQLAAMEEDDSGQSKALTYLSTYDPESRHLLDVSQTFEQDARALGGNISFDINEEDLPKFNSYFVPNGLGDQVEEASDTNGIEAYQTAGMVNFLMKHPNETEESINADTWLQRQLHLNELMFATTSMHKQYVLRKLEREGIKK
mgnify:CR=1 FL=1